MTTATALMAQICATHMCYDKCSDDKISIIGANSIGTACLFAILSEKVSTELVLIDENLNETSEEFEDLQNASVYMGNPRITFSTDYEQSRNSRVIVLAVGQYSGSSEKLDLILLEKNISIYKNIIPQCLVHSPKCTLVVVTRPVDIMSYVAWKISGLEPNQVIGTGCSLLTARFRDCIAQKLNISTKLIQAYVIGENGTKCVPLWSSVSACGVRLRDINPELGSDDDPEDWQEIFQDILERSYNNVKANKLNAWGIAASIAHISYNIIWNKKECITVSTHIKGQNSGINKNEDVFLSLPCIIGCHGVLYVVRQALNNKEIERFQNSADKLYNIQLNLNL